MSSEDDPRLYVPMDLMILDLRTLDVFNTCISFDDSPIWSPDSEYLVIQHPEPKPNLPSFVVLNVDAGWAMGVLSNDSENEYRYPVGWLDSERSDLARREFPVPAVVLTAGLLRTKQTSSNLRFVPIFSLTQSEHLC